MLKLLYVLVAKYGNLCLGILIMVIGFSVVVVENYDFLFVVSFGLTIEIVGSSRSIELFNTYSLDDGLSRNGWSVHFCDFYGIENEMLESELDGI